MLVIEFLSSYETYDLNISIYFQAINKVDVVTEKCEYIELLKYAYLPKAQRRTEKVKRIIDVKMEKDCNFFDVMFQLQQTYNFDFESFVNNELSFLAMSIYSDTLNNEQINGLVEKMKTYEDERNKIIKNHLDSFFYDDVSKIIISYVV